MLFILLFAWAMVLVIWLVARRKGGAAVVLTRHPNTWRDVLGAQWPLLLGVHLLLFAAILFGMRLAANPLYNVGLTSPDEMGEVIYSEWPVDFWIGPFGICVALVAVIVLLTTIASDRWAQWRGDIILIAGVVLAVGVTAFVCSKQSGGFWAAGRVHHIALKAGNQVEAISITQNLYVMRERQYGMLLDLFPPLLLIASGLLIVNWPGLRSNQPRFSRCALWGALLIVLSPFGAPIVTSILGFVAVAQIKRSRGKLYGLRLAAVEALLLPWILTFAVIGGVIALLVYGVLVSISHPGAGFHTTASGPSGGTVADGPAGYIAPGPPILISILPTLIISFFIGRIMRRAIVGRPVRAVPSGPSGAPKKPITRFRDLPGEEKRQARWKLLPFRVAYVAMLAAGIAAIICLWPVPIHEECAINLQPNSHAYQSLQINGDFHGSQTAFGPINYEQRPSMELMLTCTFNDGTSQKMKVELPGLRFRDNRLSQVDLPLDRDELRQWLKLWKEHNDRKMSDEEWVAADARVVKEAKDIIALLKRYTILLPATLNEFRAAVNDETSLDFADGGGSFQGLGAARITPPVFLRMSAMCILLYLLLTALYLTVALPVKRLAVARAGITPAGAGQPPSPAQGHPSHFQLPPRRDFYRWGIIAASMAVYAVAFFLPVTFVSILKPGFSASSGAMTGIEVFRMSLKGGYAVWFANPLLWLGWILLAFRQRWIAALLGLAAMVLALSELRIFQPDSALDMRSGYYCWAASQIIFAIGALVVGIRFHRAKNRI